jgi:hypothetical protein
MERETAVQISASPFEEYDVSIPRSAPKPRTPFATNPPKPELPEKINGVPMQAVINDLLRRQGCDHRW